MKTFDEASYNEGRAAFAAGATLRSIFEQFADEKLDEAKAISGALGFADALLDHLRKPVTISTIEQLPIGNSA